MANGRFFNFFDSRLGILAGVGLSFTQLVTLISIVPVYFIASKIGFSMAFVAEQVTVVWPPTGIALAVILLMGYKAWPAIFLGAFLANITSNEPFWVASAIAGGNTLEAVAGAWMLRHFLHFDTRLNHVTDVLGLTFFAAVLGTMISATVGALSLCIGGLQPWSQYGFLWLTWWLGDACGALVVAPFLLVWFSQPLALHRQRFSEALLLMAGLLLFCLAVFLSVSLVQTAFIYIIFPFLIWAALRFGQHGITTVILIASGTAIWATLHHMGPFKSGTVEESLILLQSFMGIVALTGLCMGGALAERREVEQRKDEFLGILAHELRNPLAPISNALNILNMGGSVERQAKAREAIGRQVGHMVRLVDDLLDLSRITHGKIALRKEILALNDVVDEAIEIAMPFLQDAHHEFTVEMLSTPIFIEGDMVRLSQVFSNLLCNAAKYTPRGGEISLKVVPQDGHADIIIQDNGIGISADVLPRVFDMFMQADSSLEREQGGLGIGLTLAKRLVVLHGGSIRADSIGKNQGSTFIVRLPVIKSESVPVYQPPPDSKNLAAEPAPGAAHRILIVDDNQASAQTMGWMIEMLGHEYRLAFSAAAAFGEARQFQPDVLLLDIGLPDMNGYDLCQALQKEEVLKDCIFIAQTGWGTKDHLDRSKKAGFHHHLVKPIDMEELKSVLKSLLASKKPRQSA